MDLGNMGQEAAGHLVELMADHKVLVFRHQLLDGFEYARFGRMFGDPVAEDLDTGPDRPAQVGEIHIAADQRQEINFWHMDHSFREHPSRYISLYAQRLPPCGGDTLFANLEAAYEGLSATLKDRISGLYVEHAYTETQNSRRRFTPEQIAARSAQPPVHHPLVARNEATGRPYLFVNTPVYSRRIVGLADDEAVPLLAELYQYASRPEFSMRLAWKPGTLVIWENSHCLHYPVADYFGHERLLWRMVIP